MKKICLILLCLCPLIAFGQRFVLTPYGLSDADDVNKDFLILYFDGKSAAELYIATKSYINQTMRNPRFAIKSDVENDYIRYDMFVPQITSIKKMGVKLNAEAQFSVEIRFKDGRIRYNILNLYFPFDNSDNEITLIGSNWGSWHFFDKKGKIKLSDQKTDVERFFNNEVHDLKTFILNHGNNDIEDW